jgi:mannose-6-phosphate isomerase-like protein (cupin superfamily)
MRIQYPTAGRGCLSGVPVVMSNTFVRHESGADLETWSDEIRGHVRFRTTFGADAATGAFTVGVTELEPEGWLGLHRHRPAETYHVLSGEGVVRIEGEEHAVTAGSTVVIPGDAEHGIQNTGGVVLRFLFVFAVASLGEVEYQWSDARPV